MLNDIYQHLHPVAFYVGSVPIRWYGLAYVAAFIIGAGLMLSIAKRWRIRFGIDELLSFLLCIIGGVIIGGRLGYVVFYGSAYYFNGHVLEIFMPQDGGMSFHGGLIGALVATLIASRIIKMPFGSLMDLCAIVTPIGLCLGRIANFINGELWGSVCDCPWGVVFHGLAGEMSRHPTQLYEAVLEGLVLFAILFALSYKKPPLPQLSYSSIFLIWYALVRFGIEFVRQPDVQLGYLWGGWLTMGQLLSIPLLLAGLVLFWHANRVGHPQEGCREAQK